MLTNKGAQAIARGDVVRNVKVNPHKSSPVIVGRPGTHHDLDGLYEFAAKKSSGKNY